MLMSKKKSDTNASKEIACTNLEVVEIDSITPWEKNPKRYKNKIDQIADSIKRYGQRTPVSVWVKNGVIYKGNNTWYAMKKLKRTKIAVLWEEFTDETEATGYALIDNKTGEDQEWDPGKLASLLQGEQFKGLSTEEISSMTGFKEGDLRSFLLTSEELPDVLPDVDIEGGKPDKADFMVIQFADRDEMAAFKKRLGFETKHPRVVPYADLLTVMQWTNEEPVRQVTKNRMLRNFKLKR